MQRVTAGILSYNRKAALKVTLDAVLAIPGLRVVVIDNASKDGSAEMLRAEYGREQWPQLRCIFLEENQGIAARNIFMQEVVTDFFLTLDDDSWPRSAKDLVRMLELMERDARVASICASCIHPDTGVAETAGIERFASGGDAARGYDVVNIAAGGSLLRMEALRQTHGYGEEFFWGREENDLAFQLLQKGWRVVYFPDAVVWHAMSATGRNVYRRLQYVTRNSIWLLWKYFPLVIAFPLATLFTLRRLLAIIVDPRRLAPVLKGAASGFAALPARRRSGRRFTMKQSWQLRGWFLKTLYE
ncbi:glycosyltransferase [bacterium]|nr:glycosyltransferase [bacterium]